MCMTKYSEPDADLAGTSIGPLEETSWFISGLDAELGWSIQSWDLLLKIDSFVGAGEEGLPNNSQKKIGITCALSRAKLHTCSAVSDVPSSGALHLPFANVKTQQWCFFWVSYLHAESIWQLIYPHNGWWVHYLKTWRFGKRVNYLIGPHSKMDILVWQQDASSCGPNVPHHFFGEDATLVYKPSYVNELFTQL